MQWTRHGRAAVALLAAAFALAGAGTGTAQGADFSVVDDGWITDPSVTPSAFAPGAARAPNGDIVVTYNTDGDGISGARVWLQRSTDDGATWSAPVLVKAPSQYPSGGSVNAQLSLTTLSDGTMLLPITESRTNTRYTDRESVTWVMRSTDSGRTWTGGTTPISFPVPMYFNASFGRVVEAGGALLMPVWGAPTAPSTPGGLINPTPWQAGVLRSTDGGRTWGSYHLIGADLVAPPYTADLPANVTETVVTPLPDGRLLAVLRSDSILGNGTRWFYQSWSSDGGLTWSRLVQSHIAGDGHDLFPVACGTSGSKLVLAHEDPVSHQVIARVSYDGGVRWIDPLVLTRPAGSGTAGHDIYPAFVTLPGNRLLVVYSHVPIDTHKRIAYNVLQDVSPATCASHAAAALATAADQPGVYVERADAADWPLPYGRRELFASASSTVASLATAATPEVTCAPGSVTLYENGRALSPTATLAAAGIANGDRVSVLGTPSTDAVEVGLADSDTYPDRRKLYGFDSACPIRMALDWRNRSVGLRVALGSGQQVTAISLRDSDASTRLTTADYRLWTSADNQTWTEVRGWTLTAATSGGRLTHTFSGLALRARYVKVSQRYADTAATFVILDSRSDVTATITP